MLAGLLALVGVMPALLYKTAYPTTCRILGYFRAEEANPPELVGTWIGWDTASPTPCCRLDLSGDGTGRCAFWWGEGRAEAWRVTRWCVSRQGRIEVSVETPRRSEEMRGEVSEDMLLLQYFGRDDPDVVRGWLGPLHLVREDAAAEAREAIRRALQTR